MNIIYSNKEKLICKLYINKVKENNKMMNSFEIVIYNTLTQKNRLLPMAVCFRRDHFPWTDQNAKIISFLLSQGTLPQCTSSLARWKGHKKHEVIMEEVEERNIWKRGHNSTGNLASIVQLLRQQLIISGDIGSA